MKRWVLNVVEYFGCVVENRVADVGPPKHQLAVIAADYRLTGNLPLSSERLVVDPWMTC